MMTDSNGVTPQKTCEDGAILPFGWLSLFLLLYVFLPAFILSVFLLLRVGSPALAYWASLAALSGLALAAGGTKRLIAGCLCFLLLVVFAHAVSWHFFDVFHDGLAYHQHATARIANGFNPVHDGYMYLIEPHGIWRDNWSDAATHFPKLTWYFAATIYSALGDIQTGTAYHLILLFAALFFVIHHTRGERFIKRLLWVLACLNPIVFIQATGFVIDGAIASLSIIALFYAWLHFSGKQIPRNAHVMGVVSLAMLFCIKHPGVAFGGIVIICICLHRLFAEYRIFKKSLIGAFMAAVKLGLRIGLPLLLLVAVLGFSPYLTNLLSGRHIFYPLMGVSEASYSTYFPDALENLAQRVYPDAHNRVTRLLTSIASYPTASFMTAQSHAVIKNPLSIPRHEWLMHTPGSEILAGGMGPLFFLLVLLSLPFCIFLRNGEGQGNGWLVLTLCLMLLIHPHAWLFRYVPFLWALPFFLCLPTPRRWDHYILAVPILLGAINTGGVAYISLQSAERSRQIFTEALAPHRGEYVLLDRSIFRSDGIFNRFGITQRFANPEETVFPNIYFFHGHWARRIPGRLMFGSQIAFEADIPPLPMLPVIFSEESAQPWIRMSSGIVDSGEESTLLDTILHPDLVGLDQVVEQRRWNQFIQNAPRGFWNYLDRVKFFIRVTEKPTSSIEFALTARLREIEGSIRPQRMLVHADEFLIDEWLWASSEQEEKTVTLPLEVLEEVHASPLNLLVLRFEITDEALGPSQRFSIMFDKMEFRVPVF